MPKLSVGPLCVISVCFSSLLWTIPFSFHLQYIFSLLVLHVTVHQLKRNKTWYPPLCHFPLNFLQPINHSCLFKLHGLQLVLLGRE
ncbi:hypothetical protein VIGAN_09104000 [Vigna angularis var. angularis]|uniref:Uncharacterized protein n=1 Tax=Vigna angularis var. angularis TaxID=157739 RepID=A0A0S3SX81_PHAAN|nr:hypothetical protein VIGAN_09104000 [Vigna angularis var. angularis]